MARGEEEPAEGVAGGDCARHLHPGSLAGRARAPVYSPRPEAGPSRAPAAQIALRTSLRAQEVKRLRISWVEAAPEGDPVPAYVRVPVLSTKTKKAEKVIGLTREALDVLITAYDLQAPADQAVDAPLLNLDAGGSFTSAAKAIGYDQNITMRDLRACHGTYGSNCGDIVAVQMTMGHKDLRTTSLYIKDRNVRGTASVLAVGRLLRPPASTGGDPCRFCGRR